MTTSKYLEMCDQLGQEPDLSKIPPELSDFPELIQYAIIAYNSLGDRVAADIGFLGKSWEKLGWLFDSYRIDSIEDKELFVEVLEWIERRAIKASSESMKRQHDKIKNKHKAGASTPRV